jgi:hypothetical protein
MMGTCALVRQPMRTHGSDAGSGNPFIVTLADRLPLPAALGNHLDYLTAVAVMDRI